MQSLTNGKEKKKYNSLPLSFIEIQRKLLNNQNYNFQTLWVIIYADESDLVETTYIACCRFFYNYFREKLPEFEILYLS